MAKKSQRSPIGLNLTPELPEVVSRDFNLFYTPQKEPEVAAALQPLLDFVESSARGITRP